MSDSLIRSQLVNLLTVRQAHMSLEDAVKGFPATHFNTKPTNVEYSFWHLLEHIRIAQWDILDYSRNPQYKHIEWPRDYWPAKDTLTDQAGWNRTLDQLTADRDTLVALIQDPKSDLYAAIPHGSDGHTILREILVVAQHNSYHLGEFAILRQVMGLW